MRVAALDLDLRTYQRHSLHAEDRAWVEKNCYFDVWIEVVHALGCDPHAMLPVAVALDFEGDQWTFYKPPHDELRDLYGIEVNELNAWRPMLDHAVEHLPAGKLIVVEADAWWLPDVSGTDYRRQHVKSTIALVDVDIDQRRLGYFHNASFYALEGEDFDRTFQQTERDPDFLPFFAELVRTDRLVKRPPQELAALSRQLLMRHLARRPADNPIERFARRFERDLPELQSRGLPHYHAWAFATLRQLGSAAELMSVYLRWLAADGNGVSTDTGRYGDAVIAYETISSGAKTFVLKAARAVNTKRAFDTTAIFDEWAGAWETATKSLDASL
ncbi:MAG: DUF1839 family protein [Dokdonella sp.]|uniref:DUF1839 family protein n=1 Tax=Dokdonella sp. TaxID=2291710 RepID=UPI00326540FB